MKKVNAKDEILSFFENAVIAINVVVTVKSPKITFRVIAPKGDAEAIELALNNLDFDYNPAESNIKLTGFVWFEGTKKWLGRQQNRWVVYQKPKPPRKKKCY